MGKNHPKLGWDLASEHPKGAAATPCPRLQRSLGCGCPPRAGKAPLLAPLRPPPCRGACGGLSPLCWQSRLVEQEGAGGRREQRAAASWPSPGHHLPGRRKQRGDHWQEEQDEGEAVARLKEAMAATTVTDSGSMRIITEVLPATDPRVAQLAASPGPSAPATSFQVRGFRRAQPKVLGTIHIFTGIVHICFGIILTASEHVNPSLPVASGILFWLGLLLLVSGSLLVESDRRDNVLLVKTCCVVNTGVLLSTLVAALLHATAIARHIPGCDATTQFQFKPEWCFRPESKMLSDGLDSIFVIFSLLEFCAAVAALAFGYAAIKQHHYEPMVL